jgi:hypothetical protein
LPFFNNVFILTGNALYQSKIKTYNDFSPRNNATLRCGFLFYENGSKIDHAAPFE